jgi:hypothetical protein
MTEINDLFVKEAKEIVEAWSVLGIAEDMENGWERDVMVSVVKLFFNFITTIESQKEEIAKKDAALLAWMEREEKLKSAFDQLENKQIESLKAITELAVEGLKEIKGYKIQWFDSACSAMISISSSTLSEIERLQNER